MEKYPDTAVVQTDSVIGNKGGKAPLTIYFVNVSLMLGFLREANTSKSVRDNYDELYRRPGGQDFRRLFPVILTDNKSFDDLTQEDINRMMDHINSYHRKKLNAKSPYEAFCFYYGEDLAQRLRCREISEGSINLTPGLLKSNRKMSTDRRLIIMEISGVRFCLQNL